MPDSDLAQPPSTLRAVLGELARDGAVSGSELARRLGVSRAAIWKQVARLRELGLPLDAQAGLGYRLPELLELLDKDAIFAHLDPNERDRMAEIAVHWQLDSTSTHLLRQAATDARDGLACLAEVQSAGRGRRGRRWHAPLGGGLALSVLKRFDDGMARLGGLSLVAGIGAAQGLADCGIDGVGLKWPNDLHAGGRKLGGILVELGGEANGPCHAIVGIGLNLRLGAQAAAAISQPWTDLATFAPAVAVSRNRLAARVLARVTAALERFGRDGFSGFASEYARLDLLRGQPVRVLRADGHEDGVALGIDARGALRVRFADGERSVDGGEVSIRAAAGASA